MSDIITSAIEKARKDMLELSEQWFRDLLRQLNMTPEEFAEQYEIESRGPQLHKHDDDFSTNTTAVTFRESFRVVPRRKEIEH